MAREGFASIRHVESGEIMHSRIAPMEEARAIYVEQAGFEERLRAESSEPLVIWDVGLGAAANAMAAIEAYETLAANGPVRPLHLISFENDLDSLKLAMLHRDLFTYLRHGGPAGLLENGAWQSKQHPGLTWQLIRGPFLDTLTDAPAPPDLIFYDMFSSKTCGDLWSLNAFQRLFHACAGRPVELFTYTHSTASRSAMLAAGFWLAKGQSIGLKEETTIALTPQAHRLLATRPRQLLGPKWLARWERSAAKFPADVAVDTQPAVAENIRTHAQFRAGAGAGVASRT
jgi:queuine tRNA-ribosyltransferase